MFYIKKAIDLILQVLWKRAQEQCGEKQRDLVGYFEEAGLPLSDAVVGRMLRGERNPRVDGREVVRILLQFFGEQRLLYSEDEIEALGEWFYLPPGTAPSLMSRVKDTNLDVTLNPRVFQKPEQVYHQILEQLGSSYAPYVALEGLPGVGKTTLACHVGLNPLVGSWYDVVLYARPRYGEVFKAEDEATLLAVLNEFIWTLNADQEGATNIANAQSALRQLLQKKRALFILDDVADSEVVSQLFIRGVDNGLLVVVASGTTLQDVALHFHRVRLEGWRNEQARQYVGAVLDKRLLAEEEQALDALNEWAEGLPLVWVVLVELLFYEDNWSSLVDELKVRGVEGYRIRTVLDRLFDRLPGEQRRFLETWGVFASQAAVDPAAIAYVAGMGEEEARKGLQSLHRRHVLRYMRSGGRFELLPVLGHFARKKLEQSGRFEELAERHARFYARRAAPLLERQKEADWSQVVQRLLPDLPNIYRGQAWAAANRHPLAMDYFLHMAPYFSAFRDLARWQAWGETAREVVEADPAAFSAANRFSLYSQLGWGQGSFEERLAHLRRAHEIATTEMAPWNGVYTLTDLARLYTEAGQLAAAEAAFVEAWQMAKASERPKLRAHTLREIGLYYVRTHNRAGCRAVAALVVGTPPVELGGGLKGAYDVASRGEVLACAGRWAEALSAFREALAFHEAVGNRVQGSEVRLQIARCLAHLGLEEDAAREVADVEMYLDELPPGVIKRWHFVGGEVAWLRDDHQAAVKCLTAALSAPGEGMTYGWRLDFEARLALGQVHQALGQDDQARALLEEACELAEEKGQPFWLWEAKRCLLVFDGPLDPPPQVSDLLMHLRGQVLGAPP